MKFERFCDHVYVLRTPFGAVTSAVTLVEGKEGCTLIDSGANDETVRSCILPALREFGADGRDMCRLLCTHTHGDHIGGHFMLKQLFPDMEIVVTERQAPKVADPLLYNIRIRSVYPAYSAPPSMRSGLPDMMTTASAGCMRRAGRSSAAMRCRAAARIRRASHCILIWMHTEKRWNVWKKSGPNAF